LAEHVIASKSLPARGLSNEAPHLRQVDSPCAGEQNKLKCGASVETYCCLSQPHRMAWQRSHAPATASGANLRGGGDAAVDVVADIEEESGDDKEAL